MIQLLLSADIQKSPDTPICGPLRRRVRSVDVYENVAVMPGQKAGRLYASHIIIRIDTGHIPILPLDRHHGNRQLGKFRRGQCKAHNNQPFNVIGKQLLNILPLCFLLLIPHKNKKFTGKIPDSVSRGELYNDDPVTQDARFCGTTASMCGVESAESAQDKDKWEAAVRLDVMLHAYMLSQSGIPMLYSGDEIGQLNDYSYKEDPDKAADSRYIHRGKFRWDLAEKRTNRKTLQGRIFTALHQLEQIRKNL